MQSLIPSGADLTRLLAPLTNTQLMALARQSGVPFTTLWKIRAAETTSPGIETVRKFYPLLWPVLCIPDDPAANVGPAAPEPAAAAQA